MKLSLIVAMDRNGLIGKDGGLPWGRIPEDMRHFRRLTMSKPMIVGRKTFDAVGRALDGRDKLVLTSRPDTLPDDMFPETTWIRDVADALDTMSIYYRGGEAFVIGGAQTYAAFRDVVSEAHVTLIDGEFEGDTYFPFPLLGSPDWTPLAEPETLAPGVVHHHLGRIGR